MNSSSGDTKKLKEKSNKSVSHKLKSSKSKSNSMNSEQQNRLNENFMDLMKTLAYIMRKKKDFMRAKAYENAYDSIGRIKDDIVDPSTLRGVPNIGNAIFEKLTEHYKTGTLRILEMEKDLVEKKKAIDAFTDVYGMGEKKAEEVVDKGILTLDELRQNTDLLNDKQKIGLQYVDDIVQRIPRSEIDQYKALFDEIFASVSKDSIDKMEIVGSYRRGAAHSGDIDAIITSNDPSVYEGFVNRLLEKGVIKEVLSRGKTKCLVIAQLPNSSVARRVDFLYTSLVEYPFAVLYFTGSKEFNTSMREQALKMGYTLNEHGFSKMENRKKGDKLDRVFSSEEEIFDFLNMVYKEPTARNTSKIEYKVRTDLKDMKASPEEKVYKETVSPKKKVHKKTLKKEIRKITKTKKEKQDKKVSLSPKKESSMETADLIENFKKNGPKVLESLSEKQLSKMIELANDAFHRDGQPIMEDNAFDLMREFVENKFPKAKALEEVGAPVGKNKVSLPYEMWSMDKIKPDTNIIDRWREKYTGPYVISCKLDGVSGLYSTEGERPKLYTRGDGKVGQDISHMIPYLQLPSTKGVVVRGEFIIEKSLFETKYSQQFANPRNLVAGIVNQKTTDPSKYADIHFVAYEVIKHPDVEESQLTASKQMHLMDEMNIETVKYKLLNSDGLDNNVLSELLQRWRSEYFYEIDGIIVVNDKVYDRVTGNPKHAFAFKMVLSDQLVESHVVDVLWTASKDGYLKPRVQINPVKIGGVTITYATGFNGAFIESNKIGVGAVISLIRSGDVIPYIKSVIAPASSAKMPDVEYVWNDTHIDIMLKDKNQDATVLEKNISGFFKQLEVDGLASGNVKKLMQAGFDTICKIIHMTEAEFLSVDGFKEKMAQKLYNGIKDKIENASLIQLAFSSNTFGRGFSQKKIELIFENEPDILTSADSDDAKIGKLQAIKGLERKTAQAFVNHIDNFKAFLKECRLEDKLTKRRSQRLSDKVENHELNEKTIVMTGFRDKELELRLKTLGAKSGSSVNKNTFVLLVKSKEDDSSKKKDAEKHGIPIMTKEEFVSQFKL